MRLIKTKNIRRKLNFHFRVILQSYTFILKQKKFWCCYISTCSGRWAPLIYGCSFSGITKAWYTAVNSTLWTIWPSLAVRRSQTSTLLYIFHLQGDPWVATIQPLERLFLTDWWTLVSAATGLRALKWRFFCCHLRVEQPTVCLKTAGAALPESF